MERLKEIIKNTIPPKYLEMINNILFPKHDMEDMKQEVWLDLSRLYYKYEDDEQKRAFREVMHEISEKIDEGNWDVIYNKLRRRKV